MFFLILHNKNYPNHHSIFLILVVTHRLLIGPSAFTSIIFFDTIRVFTKLPNSKFAIWFSCRLVKLPFGNVAEWPSCFMVVLPNGKVADLQDCLLVSLPIGFCRLENCRMVKLPIFVAEWHRLIIDYLLMVYLESHKALA